MPGVDLGALFDFTPDDTTPQASTPALQPVDEPAAVVDSGDDTDTVPVFDLTDEDHSDPVSESLSPDIEHRSDASAEEATPWFDSLTDDTEPAHASEVSSEPAYASDVSSEAAYASDVSSEAAYASEVSEELEADEPPPDTIPESAVIAAAQGVPTPVMRSGVGRTGVMVGLGVAIVSGIVIMALMSTRGVAAPAAGAAAPNPAKPARPAPSQPAQTSPATAVASAPQWSRNNAEWVGRQRNSAAFELASINKVAVWMRHVQPMLVVRCSAQKPEVFVFTASAAKMEPQDENHTVRVQFDSDAISTERWPDSSEHDALFAPDGQAFLQRLLTAQRLQFGFSPHNADPVVATFQVAGFAEHLASAARQCGWKNR